MRTSIIILILFTLTSCEKFKENFGTENDKTAIKVVFMGPNSEIRSQIESRYLGANLAVEEINQSGGLNGQKLRLIFVNDSGNIEFARKKVDELHQQKLDLILGSAWSEVTLGIAPNIIKNQQLLISYSATNSDISHIADSNLIWRTCPSDSIQAKILAKYASDQLKINTVSILYEENKWSSGIVNNFMNSAQTNHIQIIRKIKYKPNDNTILDSLFKNEPQAVLLALLRSNGIKTLNSISKENRFSTDYKPYLLVGDALKTGDILINTSEEIQEQIIGTVPAQSTSNEINIKFQEDYQNRYGFSAGAFNAHAYDAIYILALAIAASDYSLNPNIIKNNLKQISENTSGNDLVITPYKFQEGLMLLQQNQTIDYSGASGDINFNENGDPQSVVYHIWAIKNKEFVVLDEIIL